MIRNLMICITTALALMSVPQAFADNILLTLDLRNNFRNAALGGGTWQLFVRKVETSTGAQGDFGVSNFRALINNIDLSSITFRPFIGQMTSGGPFTQTLSNGTVEIIYQQDLNGTVVNGVGVESNVMRDRLIASGSWPAGPRPTFGLDPNNLASAGAFLGGNTAPYPPSVPANDTLTSVVTLGDFNNTFTITNADTNGFIAALTGGPAVYNPAADFNQSGFVSGQDTSLYVASLTGPTLPAFTAAATVVPEPSTAIITCICFVGLLSRARRN